MSFSIELPQTYTFSLCIDRGGHTIVDTTVEVPDTREGITRAKRTVQRLMNEYTPTPKAPEPAGLNPESQPPPPTCCRQRRLHPPRPRRKSRKGRGDCFASTARSVGTPSGHSCGSTRPR